MGDEHRSYSARQPRSSPLFRLLSDHWTEFTNQYPEVFEAQHGSLRPRGERVVSKFMECGLLDYGFTRIRCAKCKAELLLPLICNSYCTSLAHVDKIPVFRGDSGYAYINSRQFNFIHFTGKVPFLRIIAIMRQGIPSFGEISLAVR